ncbi:MAG: hypothetical protein ACRDT8_12670, partial [Micromonosporaceae bacterium]
VRKKVDEEAAKNLIDPDAYEELSDSLDRLAQVLPSEEGDEQGRGKPEKPGKGHGKDNKDD